MKELIRSIKFPFSFDPVLLKEDVNKVIISSWTDHYNKTDYEGSWTSVALMSAGGKSDNIYALPQTSEEVIYTEALKSCAYFQKILEDFLFEKTSVRLLRLAAGSEIKPHKDYCLGYEDGCFRIHIPIITNPHVEFILDGKRLIMNEGECWYIDANFTHAVVNRGVEDRIHLVIDGQRNDWTDTLFFQHGQREEFVKPLPTISEEQQKQMIEELQKMNTPAALEIIRNLENSKNGRDRKTS